MNEPKITSFTGANFTGHLGESFRFQILGDGGVPIGITLSGQVKRIFRQGRRVSVVLSIPDKKCTHIYEARRIYFKGYNVKEAVMRRNAEQCCGTCK